MTLDDVAKGLCGARNRMWECLDPDDQAILRREAKWVLTEFRPRPDPVEELEEMIREESGEALPLGVLEAILRQSERIAEIARRVQP
jgi:hypothetical protein